MVENGPFFQESMRKFFTELPLLPLVAETICLFRWSRPDLWSSVDPDIEASQKALVRHIAPVRDRLMQKVQYPCIAGYSFLVPGICYQRCFNEVVDKMSAAMNNDDGCEPTFLDLGCGLA